MKLVLSLCILILGHSAFAGSSGGFDDVPAAKPAPKPSPAPSPAPAVNSPAKVTAVKKFDFPKCPKVTTNADAGQDMMAKILGVDEDFPLIVNEDKPCKGNCSRITLTELDGKLNLNLSSPSIDSPSQMCLDGDDLMVSVQYMGTRWLKLEKRTAKKFKVHMPSGYEEYNNTYTVGNK